MRVFSSLDELADSIGETFGPGPGLLVDQARIQAFADATDDHQWIHLDAERARPARSAAPSPTASSRSPCCRC